MHTLPPPHPHDTIEPVIEPFSYVSNGETALSRALINITELLAGRQRLRQLYADFNQRCASVGSYWQAGLDTLGVSVYFTATSTTPVPRDQPLVVVANHPYGLIDGLAICQWMSEHRRNFKILLNENLCRDTRIAEHTLPVDFRDNRDAKRCTIASKKAAQQTLADGGAVIIFPAGGVSTTPHWYQRQADDLEWKRFAAKLIRHSQANVVPVYFHGQNSWLFQCCSHISLALRLGLYVREVQRCRGKTIAATVGRCITPDDYRAAINTEGGTLDHQTLTQWLREQVYALSDTGG